MLKNPFVSCKSLPRFPLTSFIGRQQEIVDIQHLLNSTRLLTLWGAGGCGKSRLAFQVVTEITESSYEGIWWIELDALASPAQLLQRMALVIGLNEQPDVSLLDQLLSTIASDNGLLILDNCDRLIAECSQLVETLLLSCPRLRILVTSREALNIAGETIWHVLPLCVPDLQHLPPLEELSRYKAVELFVARAMAAQPGFYLTEENVQAVACICHHLDGIPLAIELAAMRIKALSLEQIVARLDDCCQFLASGYRTASPRHQNLCTTIDWSYNLLTEKERCMLRWLSVFMDSFTLEAAETQCRKEGLEEKEILPLLSRLMDKSLLLIEKQDAHVHYRLLEMVRQYSRARLSVKEATDTQEVPGKVLQLHPVIDPERTPVNVPKLVVSSSIETMRLPPPDKITMKAATLSTPAVAHQESTLLRPVKLEVRATGGEFSEIRIFVFGRAQVYRGKHILTAADWKYAKARELLFYLLCHPNKTKEQIGLALWPDVSSSQLRSNFHSTLHHLRKALGRTEWITFEHGLYAFNHTLDYWLDLETFESSLARAQELQAQSPVQAIQYLEKGIELYRGDFLENVSIGNWYILLQKDLRKKYIDALYMLGQLFFADDQYKQAANAYRQIIISDNLEETAHHELMRCYVRQGKRNQAVRHYQGLIDILKNELDAQPNAETRELFEHFRRDEAV